MRPGSIELIPRLPADTKLSKVEQNTDMTMQLRSRTHPHIAGNPPLPHAVLQPCVTKAMHVIILVGLRSKEGQIAVLPHRHPEVVLLRTGLRKSYLGLVASTTQCVHKTMLEKGRSIPPPRKGATWHTRGVIIIIQHLQQGTCSKNG